MDKIQRYDLAGDYDLYMLEIDEGEYVKWEDIKEIIKEWQEYHRGHHKNGTQK